MKIPKKLQPLVEDGLIDEVLGQLMSGKESDVYVVRSKEDIRCAKVYKEIEHRSFHKQTQYTEGRKVRNSRRARAMEKHSKYGCNEQEVVWQNAEVDALVRLDAAGVRVPKPHCFSDGVLLMELVADAEGQVAPRLNDLQLSKDLAYKYHQCLIDEVVRMLCAGLIHGDLSEFNILIAADGPVIIDLPQVVDAAANNNAKRLFLRDVTNLSTYFGQFAPDLLLTNFGEEIWEIYENGDLLPGALLTGKFVGSSKIADVDIVLQEIEESRQEALDKIERRTQAA